VDIIGWIGWIAGRRERPEVYGTVARVRGPCHHCLAGNHNASLQDCWRQREHQLCKAHRMLTEPLNTTGTPTAPIPKEHIIDRLLSYVGYKDGRRSVGALTYRQMETAATMSIRLTKAEIAQVKALYGLDLSLWHTLTMQIKGMKHQLDMILEQDANTEVSFTEQPSVAAGAHGGPLWVLQETPAV
jgi:hypothetical protein